MTEKQRFWVADAGIGLWLAFPFVYWLSTRARWLQRCSGRTYTGEFDDCFNDMLPVFEILAFPLTFILIYPFARLAFGMFGPASDVRTYRWRFAARSGGSDYFPSFQICAAVGIVWACLHLSSLPLWLRFWYLHLYWVAWIVWFGLGAYASSPFAERPEPDGN